MRIAVEFSSEIGPSLFEAIHERLPSVRSTRVYDMGSNNYPPDTRMVFYVSPRGYCGWDEARHASGFDEYYQLESIMEVVCD